MNNDLSEYIGKTFIVTRNEITRHIKIKEVVDNRRFRCAIIKDGEELYKEEFFPEDIIKRNSERVVKY